MMSVGWTVLCRIPTRGLVPLEVCRKCPYSGEVDPSWGLKCSWWEP